MKSVRVSCEDCLVLHLDGVEGLIGELGTLPLRIARFNSLLTTVDMVSEQISLHLKETPRDVLLPKKA